MGAREVLAGMRSAGAWTWASWLAVVLAVALNAPALEARFMWDDVPQLAFIAGKESQLAARHDFDLYRLSDGDTSGLHQRMSHGLLPWWTDRAESIAHFRSLTSGLMNLDYALFGLRPLPAHLHSFLWFIAMLVLANLFFQRLLPGRAGRLAGVCFALQTFAVTPLAWWCARHVLVAATFGLFGMLAFVEWRAGRWPRAGKLLAFAAMALSLLSGETGMQMCALFVALVVHDAVVSRTGWRGLVSTMAPLGALVLAYFAARGIQGYGVRAAAHYVDPLRDTGLFLANARANLLPTTIDAWTNPLGPLLQEKLGVPEAVAPWILGGALALIACAVAAARAGGDRPRPYWLLAAFPLALVPCFSSWIWIRPWTLLVPTLCVAGWLGVILARALGEPGAARDAMAARAVAMVASIVVIAKLVAGLYFIPQGALDEVTQKIVGPEYYAPLPAERMPARLLIVNGTSRAEDALQEAILQGRPQARIEGSWRLSDQDSGTPLARRASVDALELSQPDGAIVSNAFYRGAGRAFRVGEEVVLRGLRARVLEVSDEGVTRVLITVDRSLDDPSVLVTSEGPDGRLVSVKVPPVGGNFVLPEPPADE